MITRTRHKKTPLATLIFLTLLCLPFTSNAEPETSYVDHGSRSLPDPQLLALAKTTEVANKGVHRDHFQALGENLCGSYNTQGDIVQDMKSTIKTTMGKVKKDPDFQPTDRELFEFLNTHTNKLTCWGKHYLAVAFDKGVYNTVYKDFLKIDSDEPGAFKINFNSVTMMRNPKTGHKEPMTILDYVHHVMLEDPAVLKDRGATEDMKYIRGKMRGSDNHSALFYKEIEAAKK